jgi:hypothetical protein
MQSTPFNLESVIAVLQRRGKQIAVFVFVSLITATIAVLVSPKYYRSGALVVPANAALADKGRIFNGSIQNLYSFLGNGDDIEILFGIAKSDTVFYRLIDEFDLVNYYHAKGDNAGIKRKSTLNALEKDLKIEKTEFNQLTISIYTKEAVLSANIVNATIDILQEIEQQMWKQVYQNSLHQLERSDKDLENQYRLINDSISNTTVGYKKEMFETKRQSILEQLKQFQKSENELKLALATTPPALYIIEKAFPSVSQDKPSLLPTLLAVFFISLIFAIIAALVFERKQAG